MKLRITSQKRTFFESRLQDFFKKTGRSELPWRKRGMTAYEIWVSEIMLQQTQVSRVIGYYERFLRRFPNIEVLARSRWETFLPYYEGLGYYARGRNMLHAAKIIVQEHNGVFPKRKQELERIPGIGPYTAAAILSFAYDLRYIAWDTNVRRVIGRFFSGSKHASLDGYDWEKHLSLSRRTLNAALMDLGSALCTARPKCGACPLQLKCVYFRERGKNEISQKKKKLFLWNKSRSFDSVEVFLHERHQFYYSSHKKSYRPFSLPQGIVTRSLIKKYFKERYGLTLAVRPPHTIRVTEQGVVAEVNAQILLGRPLFALFPKSAIVQYTKEK